MWYGWNPDPDPQLESQWAPKGQENNPDANYLVLKEERKDGDGPSYRCIYGKTGSHFGWIGKAYLKSNYALWNDPWKKQKEWAKQFGFAWKDSI